MGEIDIQSLTEQISNHMIARLDGMNLSEEDYQEDCLILVEFNKIAAGMLQQEPGLEMEGASQPIPMDENMVMQALSLFSEGIFYAIAKCAENGVTGELKKNLLQNLAMEIYNQSRQIVAATFGQEHTPGFQFSHEQQVDIIHKATEGHLMAFISEYEDLNGPIQPEQQDQPQQQAAAPPPQASTHQAQQSTQKPAAPQAGPAAPNKPQGPTGHDKYGAVALLLTTLPANQRTRILKSFSQEEKELIEYYSYPQHLEQNLDLGCVEAHLKKFREMLKQGNPSLKSNAYKGIARLVESYPRQKLLSYVKDERPLVRKYLQSHYAGDASTSAYGQGTSAAEQQDQPSSDLLPARIEEILYRYLAKRLAPS